MILEASCGALSLEQKILESQKKFFFSKLKEVTMKRLQKISPGKDGVEFPSV